VPSFIANEEYLRTYGIKYKAFSQKKEEGVCTEMNYSNIAQFAATSKDMVQLTLKDIFLHLGRTVGSGRKVNVDFYIGRLYAEHGILQFSFFDTEALQRREAERSRGMHILSTAPPDGPASQVTLFFTTQHIVVITPRFRYTCQLPTLTPNPNPR